MKPTNNTPRASALIAVALSAVTLTLTLSPAHAEVPTFTLGVRVGGVLTRDRGLDPVANEDFNTQSGAFADVEVSSPTGADHLTVGFEWLTTSSSALLFQRFDVDARADYLHLTAAYRYDVLPFLAPFARAGFGVGFHRFRIDTTEYVSNDDWAFAGQAGLGLEAFTPPTLWEGAALGARLEAGYTFRAEPRFSAERAPNTPEDQPEIPRASADLGTLPNNGFTLTFDLFVRF